MLQRAGDGDIGEDEMNMLIYDFHVFLALEAFGMTIKISQHPVMSLSFFVVQQSSAMRALF